MPKFYLSIVLEASDSLCQISKVALKAEELGYSGLGFGDHYPTRARPKWRPDPFVALAILSKVTRKVELGTLALSTTTRQPMVLANGALTLYNLSERRFFLCLGVGSGKDEEYASNGFPYVSIQDRLAAFEETLAILKAFSSPRNNTEDSGFTFNGRYFRIGDSQRAPSDFPPVWVGERNSRRILKLAGKYADVVNIHCNSPKHAKEKMDLVRKFAKESGRAEEELDAVIKHFVILDKDEELVAEKLEYNELRHDGESRTQFIERQRKESPDVIIGTRDQVKAEYEPYIDAGFDKFTPILLPNSLDKVASGMELFAKLLL